MRNVGLIHKELVEMTGMKTRLGVPVAPNDSRMIFRLGGIAQVISPILKPETPPRYGYSIMVMASYDVPDKINLTKDKVGQEIIVWHWETSLELKADRIYQGYVQLIGDEWGSRFHIRNVTDVTNTYTEDPRLQDLLNQIATAEARMAELLRQIAELEAKMGWTTEEEIELANLQRLISDEEINVHNWQNKVIELEAQVVLWKARRDIARLFLSNIAPNKVQRFEQLSDYPALEYYLLPAQVGLDYLGAWGSEALEEVVAYEEKFTEALKPPTFWHDITGITEDEFTKLQDEVSARGEVFPVYSAWWISKHDFAAHKWTDLFVKYVTELVGRGESEIAIHLREVYGIRYMPWIYPDPAIIWRSKISDQEALAASEYESFFAELMAARDSLEQAKRRLWDAKAAEERYELAITRAIALRQAEVYMAKARYELELRTLDNLRALYETLLKEIELAKAQAIAEAARQREEVLKAQEKERLAIAEEQRRLAEEAEKKAAETAGAEREEWLDRMRIALELAKEAEEAAILAAQERETIARDIAIKKLELTQIELELEELKKQQQIAEELKEEAEAEVAGLPAIPKWGWYALGIGGATATVGGIAYAIKKKKRK